MSKSFSNTPYNVKSMNGIITLSDGAGTTIENGQITTKDINSSGKITAIEIEATEVLFNDDLDMNGNDILNVNDINTTLINGSAYPPPVADTLAQILTNGNSAGTNDIDMNSQDITNVNNIALTTINGSAYPPPSSVNNLEDTLLQGNSAGATSIDMNSQDLQNVDELQVDNITGRNGAGNEIRLNSDINVNGNDFQNCNFFNFSAFTGALFCPNTLQIQAGTGATTGDINLVCGHSTSEVNITGGDLDMNNNNILNCTNINTTTINGSVPATANTRFIIGNLAYSAYNQFLSLGDLFGGTGQALQINMPANIGDPAFVWANERNFYWCNNPSYRVMFCRPTSISNSLGVVLTPGIWKCKFNIGEIQPTASGNFGLNWFVDNNNSNVPNDAGGGSRVQQQKCRYYAVRGAVSNQYAVPQMDLTIYVGAPGIPSGGEVNGGYAKIVALQASTSFKPLTGYGGWSMEFEQLQAFTWNGLYNGFTPPAGRTPYGAGQLSTAGSWTIAVCN